MSIDLETLGKRAVACRRWRWLGGTLRIVPAPHEGATGYAIRVPDHGYLQTQGEYPDLSDPATLGCLLALVREAWGDPSVGIFRSALGQEWCVLIQKGGLQGFHAPTEAEALVAALEAAP